MRVVIVQNYEGTGPGLVGRALAESGADVDLIKPYEDDALPALGDRHDGLVVLGGAQSAVDDGAHPYLPQLAALMRDFAAADRAVLGICLGSQVLARAFGARNLLGAAREFGWQPVERTPDGAADPVLRAAPERFPIFQWHDDTFTLPPGAVRLASSDVAANQAFRVGRAAYGMQFHFEADRALVRQWNESFAPWLAQSQPGWAERFEAEATRFGVEADAAGLAMARAWVTMI